MKKIAFLFIILIPVICFAQFGGVSPTVNTNPKATVTPSASNIPQADANGKLDPDWLNTADIDHIGNYATLNAAITAIGSTSKDLLIDIETNSIGHHHVPANIRLVVAKGGSINTIGGPLTFDDPGSLSAGRYPIFTGTGYVRGLSEVYPEWQGAIGDGVTDSTTALARTASSVTSGGSISLAGRYFTTGTITFSNPVSIIGQGRGTGFVAASTMGATTDVLLLQPTVTNAAYRLQDFEILPESGTPGRYGIHMDGSLGELWNTVVDHVFIGNHGSYAIYADGSKNSNGTPILSTIQESILVGGVAFANCGDSVSLIHNGITGPGLGIDVNFQAGVTTFNVNRNSITSLGGIRIGTGSLATHIVGNEFETPVGFTGSNGAVIDLNGAAGNDTISGCLIADNSIQVQPAITSNGVRVNYAWRTDIHGNKFIRGATTSKDIIVTANGIDTMIGTNIWLSSTPFADMISNAGTRTMLATEYYGMFLLGNTTTIAAIDESGVPRALLGMNADGTDFLYGYHGSVALMGANGVNYLFDGSGNIAFAVGGALSSAPVEGTKTSISQLYIKPITASSAINGGLFVDVADGILKYKDSSAAVHSLY
jgi:hypothetical protein